MKREGNWQSKERKEKETIKKTHYGKQERKTSTETKAEREAKKVQREEKIYNKKSYTFSAISVADSFCFGSYRTAQTFGKLSIGLNEVFP